MSKKFLRWSKVPYAGESKPPDDPVTSTAGSWSLTYLKLHLLFADGYKQFIPFHFADDCSSLVKEKYKYRENYSYEEIENLKANKNNDRDVYTNKNVYSDKNKDRDKFKDIESSIDINKHNDKAESSSHQNRRSPHPFFHF